MAVTCTVKTAEYPLKTSSLDLPGWPEYRTTIPHPPQTPCLLPWTLFFPLYDISEYAQTHTLVESTQRLTEGDSGGLCCLTRQTP